MKNIRKTLIIIAFTILCITGCTNVNNTDNNNQTGDSTQKTQSQPTLDPNASALVKVNNRLFSVPSPIQLATVIKKLDLPYNRELLNDVNKRQDYTTSFKQALNLGIFGANLGYINVFEQLPDAAAYFGAIRTLSQELGIMNQFNEATMKRIEQNNGNKDSLLYIASIIYRESDAYLMDAERNEIGALIIAGGWVEGLYLLTHIDNIDNLPQEIIELIGQQKNPLNNLIELLRPYYGKLNDDYDKFLEELSDLATIFDTINIKYTYQPPTTDENNKITEINCVSKTEINKQQLENISKKIEKMRTKITD